ncbi:CBS domain-containing protein, partial [Nanoarchaeota archaeon]
MPECTVEKIMTSALQYVKPFDKVIDVAKHMYQSGIGSVLIKQSGAVKGILTERD